MQSKFAFFYLFAGLGVNSLCNRSDVMSPDENRELKILFIFVVLFALFSEL